MQPIVVKTDCLIYGQRGLLVLQEIVLFLVEVIVVVRPIRLLSHHKGHVAERNENEMLQE